MTGTTCYGSTDAIIIKGLEIYANHGYFPEEKKLGQKFVLDLELLVDLQAAGNSDDLAQTVHYGLVCQEVHKFFTENTFDLIETCAERTLTHLLLKYPAIAQATLQVQKPWAPIGLPLTHAAVRLTRGWTKVCIAVGSNLGNKRENIEKAVELIIANEKIRRLDRSSLYVTKPWGYEDQDDFLNGAVTVETMLTPRELLLLLQGIEQELKREKTIVNGPRTIDLDIILYGNVIIHEADLVIPHPRMQERMFVLEPLCEIEPFAVHPVYRQRLADLLSALEEKERGEANV